MPPEEVREVTDLKPDKQGNVPGHVWRIIQAKLYGQHCDVCYQ